MKKKLYRNACRLSCLLTIVTLFVACDAHRDFPDTAMKHCHILCTDGKVLPVADFKQSGKQPIAVVFHVNHNEDVDGNGYAVYLWNLEPLAFADSIGVRQNTSADILALDGFENTFVLLDARDVSSPLAGKAFALWRYGQSAYIPSVAQMRLLYHTRDQINPIIKICGGDTLPVEAGDCWYWTSTEVNGQQSLKAWLFSTSSGAIHDTPKGQAHKSRAIITLRD